MHFVGHVNVAPRHLTADAEALLLATLMHEVGRCSTKEVYAICLVTDGNLTS